METMGDFSLAMVVFLQFDENVIKFCDVNDTVHLSSVIDSSRAIKKKYIKKEAKKKLLFINNLQK